MSGFEAFCAAHLPQVIGGEVECFEAWASRFDIEIDVYGYASGAYEEIYFDPEDWAWHLYEEVCLRVQFH